MISTTRSQLLEQVMPEFAGQRDWYDLLAVDLEAAQLAPNNMHAMMSAAGVWQSATTNLADRFLRFIRTPEALDQG
jgi:hypothetical protein